MSFTKFGTFSAFIFLQFLYSFKYSLYLLLSLFSSGTLTMNTLVFLMIYYRSLNSVHIFSTSFCLLFTLDNFHFPIFKFAEAFFCLFRSAFETLVSFFVSVIVLFIFSNFWDFYLFISIPTLYIQHFLDFL